MRTIGYKLPQDAIKREAPVLGQPPCEDPPDVTQLMIEDLSIKNLIYSRSPRWEMGRNRQEREALGQPVTSLGNGT